MKISQENISAAINKVNKPVTQAPIVATKPEPERKSTSTTAAQQKMKALFARVGIAQNMIDRDARQRRHIIERRQQMLEMQKISNLQSILSIALNVSIGENQAENVDPDWFFAFAALAENIHSPAMQELWGKIFAVEVSLPGSFSLRCLETLKVLTQKDANIFSRAASIAARRSGDAVPRILVGYYKRKGIWALFSPGQAPQLNLSNHGLSYPDLLALTDMKLMYASEIESAELSTEQSIAWRCGNQTFAIKPNRAGLALVYYKFTSVGAELYKLISKQDNADYVAAIKNLLSAEFAISQENTD